jgi:hypothetical protein
VPRTHPALEPKALVRLADLYGDGKPPQRPLV